MPEPADMIELTTPVDRAWDPVVRLVLGGIADRVDLPFEELDDLQLAASSTPSSTPSAWRRPRTASWWCASRSA